MYGYNIFHDMQADELIKSVRNLQSRQAYLFTGPVGVGRHEVAKLFANALVCTNTASAPCGRCQACIGAKNATNPDIRYIKPEGDKKTVSAEQAREIVADAYIRPFESAKKVYIVDDGAVLNEFAQNCLLKVLEEPPEYVVFIIVAASETVLLQTVLSRCTLVRFPAVSDKTMKEYILKTYPKYEEKAELLTGLASGIPAMIDKIVNDENFSALRKESFTMLAPLMSSEKISAYTVTEFLENNKERAEDIFDFWLSFLRDIMLIQNNSENLIVNIDMQEELKNNSFRINEKHIIIASEQIIRAKSMLRRYVNLHILGLNLSFLIKKRMYN